MLAMLSCCAAMMDPQVLAHMAVMQKVDETLRRSDEVIKGVDRLNDRIAESKKRSEVLDQEWRRQHEEINEMLKKMGMPPLAPLPPKETVPPG